MTPHTTLRTATRDIEYTPDAAAAFQHLATRHNSLLLESADITPKKNVNCLAVLKAALKVTCTGERVHAEALTPTGEIIKARLESQLKQYREGDSFYFPRPDAADERERLQAPSNAEVLRALAFDAGYASSALPLVAGGFGYDYLATFEELPDVGAGANSFPDFEFLVAEVALMVDHLAGTATLHGVGEDPEALLKEFDTVTKADDTAAPVNSAPIRAIADRDDATFRANVEQMQEHIAAGDIYQVVPSRAFHMPCPNPYSAYRQLRETNPSPYMFYFRGTDYELIGASPESNLKFDPETRSIQLYPIAGTRPRGLNPDGSVNHELDIRHELEMRTDTKEIAEHTMLVDLARNDLARVATPGTRKVAELLQVDRYSRVMHLVSRVTSTLHPDFDALDAYRACMNMGTLTGAPKLRATELIRGIEKHRRGSYGGAVGYLRGDGTMDTCIVIRSAFVRDGQAIVQAGAGVVQDSQPQAEADETVHKAYAVLNAIAQSQGATLEVVR